MPRPMIMFGASAVIARFLLANRLP